jgi:uncharacterized OB-fold protein
MSVDATSAAARPFVDGLARHELRYQRCIACNHPQALARHACARCGGNRLAWERASGRGVVHSATTIWRAPTEAFRARVPYAIVLVDLDEGARVMGHADPGVAIGDRVAAGFQDVDGRVLLRFAPIGPDDRPERGDTPDD